MADLIICCGMRRSASTLQYQITEKLLEISGTGIPLGYVENEELKTILKKANSYPQQYVLIKTHDFTEEILLTKGLNIKYVYSYRDIRDVFVSSMKKWFDGNFESCYRSFNSLLQKSDNQWRRINDIHISSYEEIVPDLKFEIKKIADYLNINIDDSKINNIEAELNIVAQRKKIEKFNFDKFGIRVSAGTYDPKTNLHSDHIRSGKTNQWETELNSFQIATIQHDWNKWLIKNGYTIHLTLFNFRIVYFLYLHIQKTKLRLKKFLLPIIRNTRVYERYKTKKKKCE